MGIKIIQERPEDISKVQSLIENAFANAEYSDQSEHKLVGRLRQSDSFIPELSLVAVEENKIVGHILFTKIKLINNSHVMTGLSLAPVSVLPEFQGKGIGSMLITEAHRIAKDLGHPFSVVIGHKDYYPKFGYDEMNFEKITIPFEIPQEFCFILVLQDEIKSNDLLGRLEYDRAFHE